MHTFFSPLRTELPHFPLSIHFLSILCLILIAYAVQLWSHKASFQKIWRNGMLFQLIVVYTWFIWASLPLSELLPLYHCRMAMFILLFCPKGQIKDYFALIGVVGSILAMIYPAFYPYPLFHVTNLFFFTGHFGLFALSLLHLKESQTLVQINAFWIAKVTIILNSLLILVNFLTGGNYGFLADTPILHSQQPVFNLFLVSGVFILLLTLTATAFQKSLQASLVLSADKD
ncbi:YwaF family protein [Streptococcus gallolyticus]|nr:YwaF family protein [Streptococcus gallolyticus]MBY5040480.1 YwaF family protein [Streptococcus gallolyticus]